MNFGSLCLSRKLSFSCKLLNLLISIEVFIIFPYNPFNICRICMNTISLIPNITDLFFLFFIFVVVVIPSPFWLEILLILSIVFLFSHSLISILILFIYFLLLIVCLISSSFSNFLKWKLKPLTFLEVLSDFALHILKPHY